MKIKHLLLAAAAMVFAVACNEVPDEPVKPTPEVQIGVMPMEVSYVAAGGEQTVSVVAKGAWTATPDAEWIKVEPASGEAGTVSVKIYAEKNETTEAREGKVVFAVGEEKAEVAVAQQAGEPAGSDVWGIAGSHQGDTADTQWKPENAPEMGFADGYYYQKGMELKAGHEFKFVKDKAWAVNRGYSGGKPMTANYFYAVEHNGQNIKILADGTYDVYLNEEATVFYLMEAGKLPAEAKDSSELAEAEVPEADKGWRVVGTHNEWKEKDGTDYTMTLEDGLYGYKGLEFTAAGEFKFVQDRNWSKSVGVDNDAELAVNCFYAAGGSNIKVAAGTYDLYLSEDATKFYVMEAGVAPSEAKDGAAGAGVVASASITIREDEVAEDYIAFNVTTENVVAASYGVLETALVDDTITAEYILSEEGGYPLYEEELNSTVELGYRRGVTAGTEYTIFLAYEDEEGAKAMVTETVTTPGAAAGGAYYVVATSVDIFYDDLYGEGCVTFLGAEQDLVVWINAKPEANKDYFFALEPNEVGVTYVEVRTHDTKETLAEITGVDGYGSFSIYAAEAEGLYMAMAEFGNEAGVSAGATYEGAIEGLGGGAAGGTQDITFAVASATIAHVDTDYPGDNSIWELVLTSATGDTIGLVIETGYDDAPCVVSGTYDVTTAYDLAGNVGVWVYSWFNIGGSYYSIMDPEISFLGVETDYPNSDMNVFNGMFVVADGLTGKTANIYITTPTPVAIYGNGETTEAVNINWIMDENVTAVAYIDEEFGESEIHLKNAAENLQLSIYLNTTDLIDKDFYLQADAAFGATEWVTSANVRTMDGEVITNVSYIEFSFYSWEGEWYMCAYGDTGDGGEFALEYLGAVEGFEGSAGVTERYFIVESATAMRSEDYSDDDSVWYLELTSTTGDVVGFTFDQVYGAAQDATYFVGGAFQVAPYITGEMPCIDQACSWNEFGGMWKVSESDGLMIQFNDTGDPATCQYIFQGQLTAISAIDGKDTAIVSFMTDGGFINIKYLDGE